MTRLAALEASVRALTRGPIWTIWTTTAGVCIRPFEKFTIRLLRVRATPKLSPLISFSLSGCSEHGIQITPAPFGRSAITRGVRLYRQRSLCRDSLRDWSAICCRRWLRRWVLYPFEKATSVIKFTCPVSSPSGSALHSGYIAVALHYCWCR